MFGKNGCDAKEATFEVAAGASVDVQEAGKRSGSRAPYKLVESGKRHVPVYRSLARGKALYTVAYTLLGDTKRKRKSFSDEGEAIAFASSVETLEAQSSFAKEPLFGEAAVIYRRAMEALKGSDMALDEVVKEWAWAKEQLKGRTVRKAVEYFVETCPAECKPITVVKLVEEFLGGGAKTQHTRNFYRQLCRSLVNYLDEKWKPGMYLSEVTEHHLTEWIEEPGYAVKTQKHRRAMAVSIYRYAKKYQYLPNGVVSLAERLLTVRLPKGAGPVPIFETADFRRLVEYYWQRKGQSQYMEARLLYLLVGAFTGIRPYELLRLQWEDICWGERLIHVPVSIAKTGFFREVPIPKNLFKFLQSYRGRRGVLFTMNDAREVKSTYLELVGKKWPFDGLRHSFASYALKLKLHAMSELVDIMGTSKSILQRCYRRRVTVEEARKYFELAPSSLRSLKTLAS